MACLDDIPNNEGLMLFDDSKEVFGKIRAFTSKDWGLVLFQISFVAIFNLITIFKFSLTHPIRVWDPNIFCGVPAWVTGKVGYKWFNQIQVFFDGLINLFFFNPLGFLLIAYVLYHLYRRMKINEDRLHNYYIVLLVEIVVLLITPWK